MSEEREARISDLQAAIEGEFDGLGATYQQAAAIIDYMDSEQAARQSAGAANQTAKQRYDDFHVADEETDPVERLRAFCSLAMNGQDWVDVEPFFAALTAGATGQHDGNPWLRVIMERDGWRNAVTGLCTIWPKTPDEAANHLRARLHPDRAAPIGDNGATLPKSKRVELDDVLSQASDLLHTAAVCAGKLNASMTRREVSPRAEFEALVEVCDVISVCRKKLREALLARAQAKGE